MSKQLVITSLIFQSSFLLNNHGYLANLNVPQLIPQDSKVYGWENPQQL